MLKIKAIVAASRLEENMTSKQLEQSVDNLTNVGNGLKKVFTGKG